MTSAMPRPAKHRAEKNYRRTHFTHQPYRYLTVAYSASVRYNGTAAAPAFYTYMRKYTQCRINIGKSGTVMYYTFPVFISTVAASIGSAAFFAPWSESSPSILRPPFIISFCLSKLSPSHSFSSYYATEDNKVKSLLYSHKLRYLTEYFACRITL